MTDLIAFSCPLDRAEQMLEALKRDFYKGSNALAVGEPFYLVRKEGAVFLCPVVLPIGGVVGRMVKRTVFEGFNHAAKKAKGGSFKLKKLKVDKGLEDAYAEFEKDRWL